MKLKTLFLGLAAAVSAFALSSCVKTVNQATLSVEPASALTFKASNNMDVKLTVTTTASSWEFTAPEWVVAKKEGNTLIVNVKENTLETENIGRITFKAGDANPVNINVLQEAFVPQVGPQTPGAAVQIEGAGVLQKLLATKGQETKLEIFASIPKNGEEEVKAKEEIQVELIYDHEYVSEYNYLNKASTIAFPKDKITLPQSLVLTIPAGESKSNVLTLSFNAESLDFGTEYLVPLQFKAVKNAELAKEQSRLNAVIMRQNERAIKNVVYFEVNDTNPLNALEYVLADGTPFFDAIILFAANINYDSSNDVVYLHNNPNVQALLDESEVYLQPIRKAGIKVYLGLLGNHDASGLAQLSAWGAHEWAQEVAEACRKYKLDGVNLDDEYSASPIIGNKWFTYRSSGAAARLMYELKVAMKEKCSWPTEVSYFQWGSISNVPEVEVDGVTHKQSEFVDFYVANYGSASSPYGDLTMANCSGASIELNLGYTPWGGAGWADNVKNDGYGWCMWFAFDPSGSGSISSNYYRAFNLMQQASQAFYGQELKEPTGVYHKLGEGKYDPKRYDF